MPRDVILTKPVGGFNHDRLTQEIWAVYPNLFAGLRNPPLTAVQVDESVSDAQLQAIVDVHNKANLSDYQQQKADSALAKAQVKDYLRTQLINPTPNLASIKTTIEGAIGGNANIQQAISNIAALYGYDTGTDAGYVRSALLAISIMV